MNPLLKDILFRTVADDLDVRQEAILQVALLIERHWQRRGSDDYYETMLAPELVEISLGEEEQKELINAVGKIVLSNNVTGSLVWALAKCTSLDGLDFLLAFVCRDPVPDDQYAIVQALIGIHNFLCVEESHPLHDQVFDLTRKHNLMRHLKDIAVCAPDPEVAKMVDRICMQLVTS